MVCRTAYLLRRPTVWENKEERVSSWNPIKRAYDYWFEPRLLPDFSVTYSYDYGSCCGIDDSTEHFATREEAEQFIEDLMDGKVSWIIVDEEFMEDYADDD